MHQVMTATAWMEKARANADALRSLVANYHPASHNRNSPPMVITAPNAEAACGVVRERIVKESGDVNPVERFDKALASGDIGELMSLLNGAWFGVPESTECWGIEGFKVAVDLMDDPPEDDPPEQDDEELLG